MTKVAIYCRLSEEDRNKISVMDDSNSIQNQKVMLTEYAHSQGWVIYDIYSDDDYTGADRKRPQRPNNGNSRLCFVRHSQDLLESSSWLKNIFMDYFQYGGSVLLA